MKQTQITIPVSLPCLTCGGEMQSAEGSRMFVCSVWPIHTRFLTWRDLEDIERRRPKPTRERKVVRNPEPFVVNASDINWG